MRNALHWLSRKTIVILATAITIPLLAFFAWTCTPNYAIRQIRTALQTHDIQMFHKYVDVDAVAADIVTLAGEESGGGSSPIAMSMSAPLQERVKRTLTNMVESEEAGPPHIVFDFVDRNSTYDGIAYIRRNGKIATAGLKFSAIADSEPRVFEVRMRNVGTYWQVAGLNVEQIVAAKLKREVDRIARDQEAEARVVNEQQKAAQKIDEAATKAVNALQLSLSPTSVVGGGPRSAMGTLRIAVPAPSDIEIELYSRSAAASVPQSVTIPTGASTAYFVVSTTSVDHEMNAVIEAGARGSMRTALLLITPAERSEPREYVVYDRVYFDRDKREYHVSTCPTARGRALFTSYQAMVIQHIPRAQDCADLPIPSTTATVR
ncbi:MAG TPA: DUF2939 domain-containing protein [Thermoanaerobaculia bacterium]|nr:DUF2939 domain-containing protein [Thermoanaerobaculia bacterium]